MKKRKCRVCGERYDRNGGTKTTPSFGLMPDEWCPTDDRCYACFVWFLFGIFGEQPEPIIKVGEHAYTPDGVYPRDYFDNWPENAMTYDGVFNNDTPF